MYSNSILIIIAIFTMSFFQKSETETPKDLTELGVKIQQGDSVYAILKDEEELKLRKEKFTVTFNLNKVDDIAEKFYAARLVADIDSEIFNQFEAGKTFEEIPALSSGTSMAGPQNEQYDCIFFDDEAHHYIFYNNEDEKRATLMGKDENGLLQLSFDIENYCMNNLEVNITNSNFDTIYMVFVFDENLNEVVEEGEYVKLEVGFE